MTTPNTIETVQALISAAETGRYYTAASARQFIREASINASVNDDKDVAAIDAAVKAGRALLTQLKAQAAPTTAAAPAVQARAYPWTFNGPPMTEATAGERLSEMLMQVAEFMGNFPSAKVDRRSWSRLMIYAPPGEAAPVQCTHPRPLWAGDTSVEPNFWCPRCGALQIHGRWTAAATPQQPVEGQPTTNQGEQG